ncbi:WXG100 family type VII secretion target [Streptomyces sp. ISL-22]|uniref:WXG100 family type VII secretion target n=1 Tax=unclassified Streptomyces TaxID=2593676 RepID=UPI001BE53659|nr:MULTISPECIES: WXG100 family type VII secretion target [unclassified Streptomyces]MBT2421266.1 WXG100 family type VII secretion target [Streptomyces sp. ISL-24]MBT2437059.1 WXG100 family type VII secretion target [Streptomyces sp. ISL-22]
MGAGQAAGDALSRINFVLDWSNPLAGVLDEIIRGIIKQFNLDELLEQVSGDNELLAETAIQWRKAANDLRGVAEDLVVDRRALATRWQGEAFDKFDTMMTEFEEALRGEAADMDTVAELLEMAAQECAAAEQLMLELIVEIVETVLATAATTAILSLLTAGAAAAIGPLIAAAGIAHKAAKAVKITAKLADALADIAKRMQLLRKMEKARDLLRKGPKHFSGGLKRYIKKVDDQNRPIAERNPNDLLMWAGYKVVKKGVKGVVKDVIGADPAGAVQESLLEDGPGVAEERYEYHQRPDPQSFDERTDITPSNAARTVRDDFG